MSPGMGKSLFTTLKDIVLLPFRLLQTLFNYLNFKSMMYSNKPLVSSSGNPAQVPDQEFMVLRGRSVDIRKAMVKAKKDSGAPSLVPGNWELVTLPDEGSISTVAKGVVSFDIAEDDTIVYTNGSSVFKINSDGSHETIHKGSLIEDVFIL